MSYTSITAALSVPKVDGQYAPNVQFSRNGGEPDLTIMPKYNGQDNLGRPASYNSQVTLTAGFSALPRILIENGVSRPQYIPYLNASGIEGPSYENLGSFGGYGTAVPNMDQALGKFGSYSVCTINDKGPVAKQMSSQARMSAMMARKNQAQRISGRGCK